MQSPWSFDGNQQDACLTLGDLAISRYGKKNVKKQ